MSSEGSCRTDGVAGFDKGRWPVRFRRIGQTLTVHVSDTTLAIELSDGDTRVIRRITTQPVCSIKGQRPRTATPIS